MKKYKVQDFSKIFEKIGLKKGDILLVHSSLLTFGIPTDVKIGEVPSSIFEQLFAIIGMEGTLAVPTFNFDFCKGIPFNRQETPSKTMGVFSEFVRKLPNAKRSFNPMQSIAVVGKHAEFMTEKDTESSFSENGPFHKLKKLKGKILLLGANFNSVSMIHLPEEEFSVPYRYWKTFTGSYTDNEETVERSYKMYVRSLESNPKLKLYSIEKELKKSNRLKEAEIGGAEVKVFEIADFISIAENYLSRNPNFFDSNHPNFEQF